MKKTALGIVLVGCVFTMVLSKAAWGATDTQTTTLRPGWNAVFLEIDPANPDPAAVFTGVIGVESVWAWNRRTSPVEDIQNPGLPLAPPPYMLAYIPGNPDITNLHAIRGEMSYLVKIAAGAPATQPWSVTGQPAVPKVEWNANSYNLVGFHLDPALAPAAMPTYFDFFSGSAAHYLVPALPELPGPKIYVLDNPTGTWRRVVSTDKMLRGEAFWVYCQGSSAFAGPLSVQLEQGTGLDFGSILDQQEVILRNDYTADRTATVQAVYGSAKVHYGEWVSQDPPDTPAWQHVWKNLYSSHPALAVPAGGRKRLRLGAVRADLAAGATFEDNVEIKDGQGVRILLPVKVKGISTAGLWVGSVIVGKVTDNGSGSGVPTPVGSPFVFKVILHVSADPTPQVRLLREVVQLWQEGTWKPDPDNQGHLVVDQPGSFKLVANPALLGVDPDREPPPPNLRGAALRDGQEVGRRISTAAFGFTTPVLKTGGAFAPGSTLTFSLTLATDDPTNPFLHRYNKDHAAAQSYQVTRALRLQFLLDDPSGNQVGDLPVLGWGSNEVGGIFSETIGLQHADPANTSQPDSGDSSYDVDVEGTFRLRRVSDVGQLQL